MLSARILATNSVRVNKRNIMRVQGITIPDKKQLEIGLTAIYGIGRERARTILAQAGIASSTHAADLTEEQESTLRELIEGFQIEGDLKRQVSGNIKRLKDINAYRGTRHARGLPVRGQRTKTNQRTAKGNTRSTMGSGRRKVEKK
jgi:small subunit ribosomal protein S13